MYDRFQEAQQRDLAEGGLDRVFDSKKVTLVRKGRSKRGVIVPIEEFEAMRADADESRRAREIQAALDDPRPSIPAKVVHKEMRALLKKALAKNRRTSRA